MSDYFDELGHEPTGDDGPCDLEVHSKQLLIWAKMNGINVEIEVPEASKQAIAKLPNHIFKGNESPDDAECPICKSIAGEDEIFKILPCTHKFHEKCVLMWLKKSNSCPLCRYELETDDEVYEELRVFNNETSERNERVKNLMDSMFT